MNARERQAAVYASEDAALEGDDGHALGRRVDPLRPGHGRGADADRHEAAG